MTSEIAQLPLSELIIERPKSTIKVRDSSEIGAVPFYTSGIKIARHTEALCSGENIYIATGGKANFQFLDGPAAYSTDTYVITGTNRIDTKYLYYFLTSQIEYIDEHLFRGAALRHLSRPEFKELQVPLPSLPEQQRIVRLLDEAFWGITIAKANAETNLQNASAIFESHLQAVFEQCEGSWEKKPIGEVCETGSGGTPLSSQKEYYVGGTIPWLVSGEVAQGDVKNATHFITESGLQNSSAKLFPAETVVVAMYGATAGQVGILRFEAATNQAVCGILPNKRILPEFLYFALLSKKRELVAQATGNAQPNISQIKIRNTQVPVPDISAQRLVVSALSDLRESTICLGNTYAKKLAALKLLERSYLHEAFFDDVEVA
jgi:restriction endonuclease S subunit